MSQTKAYISNVRTKIPAIGSSGQLKSVSQNTKGCESATSDLSQQGTQLQSLGISLHQITFVWLVFAGTLNLLTHFVVIISSHCTVYIFIYVIISFLCEEIVVVIVIVVQRGSNPVAAQTRVGVVHSDLLWLVHGSATEF